jgi:hypothetical protein
MQIYAYNTDIIGTENIVANFIAFRAPLGAFFWLAVLQSQKVGKNVNKWEPPRKCPLCESRPTKKIIWNLYSFI